MAWLIGLGSTEQQQANSSCPLNAVVEPCCAVDRPCVGLHNVLSDMSRMIDVKDTGHGRPGLASQAQRESQQRRPARIAKQHIASFCQKPQRQACMHMLPCMFLGVSRHAGVHFASTSFSAEEFRLQLLKANWQTHKDVVPASRLKYQRTFPVGASAAVSLC